MLNGIHVNQPKRFLPLADKAQKLAKEVLKEQVVSQWAGLPPEKLLQESFIEQLNALQSLDQLAPITAVKEHLPRDIINILELLGKADNIPFNQHYNLAEDCADRYYTKVIKMLTNLLKNSFLDRQLILVNSACALKSLETYVARQVKLWKVLSKNHQLPDHFHNLKMTLKQEFDLLKKATSRNIHNIHEAVQMQQVYTTALCGQVNQIYIKLVQLEGQVQTHCLYPHQRLPQSDTVQLNIPDFNPDIDETPNPVTQTESLNAKSSKEDSTSDSGQTGQQSVSTPPPNRTGLQPEQVSDDISEPEHQSRERQ